MFLQVVNLNIDVNINFNEHISDLCKKASRKISALARIAPFMSIEKRKVVVNALFTTQFSYCPLVWICHSRTKNSKINKLDERCLRIICNDKQSSFTELVSKNSSVSIHIKNIQKLAIEMFKSYKGLSPHIIDNVFKLRTENLYSLRQVSEFSRPIVKTVYHGTKSLSYLGPKIWDILPEKLRNMDDLESFKKEIKTWRPDNCPCRLCKVYIEGVGFL